MEAHRDQEGAVGGFRSLRIRQCAPVFLISHCWYNCSSANYQGEGPITSIVVNFQVK
jgi:hypothetical protein